MFPPENKLGFTENFVLANISTLITVTLSLPVNMYKKLLVAGIDTHYKKIKLFVKRIKRYKSDKLHFSFKDYYINGLRYSIYQGLTFALKEKFKNFFKPSLAKNRKDFFFKNILSGALSGTLLYMMFIYPFEKSSKNYHLNTIKTKIWEIKEKSQRITVLKRNLFLRSLYVSIDRGFYFGLYDSLRINYSSVFSLFVVAYYTSLTASFLSYPFLNIRIRYDSCDDPSKYKGEFDFAKKTIINQGPVSLFNGCSRMIYASVSAAGILVGFDKLVESYSRGSRLLNA
jgi:hypothetical protein